MLPMCSIWNPPGFVTQHSFDERGKWNPTKDLMIPFQQYSFNAFAFAIDPTTNRSVPIAMFGVLDILGDFLIRSQDAGGMGKFTFNSGNGSVTTEVEARLLRVEITRTAVAKAFAVWMFLTNWTLSVGSVYITALVVFRRLEANSMVAALPFSALLAIPTIRSLYIDSPPLRVSIGKSHLPSSLPFHRLIHCPRCSSVFRTGCDRRIVFLGPVESPHQSSISVIAPNGVPRLNLYNVHV